MKLTDRVALITGGGSGIGQAIAHLFAQEGAKIVVADFNEVTGQATVDDLRSQGADSIFVKVDVPQAQSVEQMVAAVDQHYGRLDIMVTSAGIGELGTVVGASEDHWDRTIDINLKGTWLSAKYSIPLMERNGSGNIITLASVAGLHTLRRNVAYGPSKTGVIYLTKLIALEHGPLIRANSLCPGVTDTPMMTRDIEATDDPDEEMRIILASTVLGRVAKTEEVAKAALFLASDDSSYITGVALPVDGGRLLKINPTGVLE